MKKFSALIASIAILALVAAAWHRWRPASAPGRQPPLVSLTSENFAQLQNAFNEASGKVRVVLLLSPT